MCVLVHYSHAIHLLMRFWIINALNNAFWEAFQHFKLVNAEIMRIKRVLMHILMHYSLSFE